MQKGKRSAASGVNAKDTAAGVCARWRLPVVLKFSIQIRSSAFAPVQKPLTQAVPKGVIIRQ